MHPDPYAAANHPVDRAQVGFLQAGATTHRFTGEALANVGERYIDRDRRRPRRVVEIDSIAATGYMLRTIEHPVKPGAVGRIYPITYATFDKFYQRF